MSIRDDYRRWHHAQVATGDLDPAYPVLRHLAEARGLDREQRVWLAVCHVTQYHLASTLRLFEAFPTPGAIPSAPIGRKAVLGLPSTTERRAHRDVRKLDKHLAALAATLGPQPSLWAWFEGPGWSWETVTDRVTGVWGNGRWAAYKLAELLQKVAGAPITAPDAGHRYSSGPRKGLDRLYEGLPTGQTPEAVRVLDAVTLALAEWVGEPDVAQVETSLCDFNSLVKGHYYLGHDIDGMLAQIAHPALGERDRADLLTARRASFDHLLLGEVCGWGGPRTALKRVYRETGAF